jgi:hypothetical protein
LAVTTQLARQAIVTEIERARLAWNAVGGNYTLLVDYENFNEVDLSSQVNPYLAVDIVFRDTNQLDLGLAPILRDDGQIMLAVGVKEGGGTQEASRLLDFIRPYLQLRTDLLNGVRTHESKVQPPRRVAGFYFVPVVIGFWQDAVAPVTP